MDLYTHPSCLEHEVPIGHPERPERLATLLSHIERLDFWKELTPKAAPLASRLDLERVHAPELVSTIEEMAPKTGMVHLDADTTMSPRSLEAAGHAAGSVAAAVRRALSGESPRAFCAVRPPGHHAESKAAMGFCLFNSVAIAADVALDTVDRVAILDFDVHHCNGTVEMFAERPEVLVCSTFQFPFYPGRFQQVRRPNIINSPLPAGAASDLFRLRVETEWIPAIDRHQPEIVLVSAGFDAHRDDPLAEINLVDDDFRWITNEIVSAANRHAQGRIVSTLEGGYNLAALARCVELHLEALL